MGPLVVPLAILSDRVLFFFAIDNSSLSFIIALPIVLLLASAASRRTTLRCNELARVHTRLHTSS